MKEKLDEQSILALIHYRMERADEAKEEASILSGSGHYNAAVNRLYYACFYSTQALLLSHQITAITHSGVKSMLGKHFVSKGIISVELGKTFNILFEKRHSSDYEVFAYCDKAMVDDLSSLSEAYISRIKNLLEEQNKI